MKGYVYVLISSKDLKTYTGSTDCLEKRIKQHQDGKVKSTRLRLPVRLVHFEEYETLQEARFAEKYYKSCSGRNKLKEILKKYKN